MVLKASRKSTSMSCNGPSCTYRPAATSGYATGWAMWCEVLSVKCEEYCVKELKHSVGENRTVKLH